MTAAKERAAAVAFILAEASRQCDVDSPIRSYCATVLIGVAKSIRHAEHVDLPAPHNPRKGARTRSAR
jgi:hypothetical protein